MTVDYLDFDLVVTLSADIADIEMLLRDIEDAYASEQDLNEVIYEEVQYGL